MPGKTSKYILIQLLILCILITSCSKQTKVTQKEGDANQISKDLQYLCSDECGGRQPGTEGNIRAGDYIANRFKELGLRPLDSDYQVPYKKQTESINKMNLELLDAGKSVHTFEYGKDYVEISLDNTNLKLPMYNEPANSDCVVLTDDALKLNAYEKDSHTKMIILEEKGKYAKPSSFYNKGIIPQIRVTEMAFDFLKDNIGKTIQFNADIDVQEEEHKNIVGLIQGENHDSAFLVSAHFDHIGSIGKAGTPGYVIWKGALDNASGVSTMLQTAKLLQDIYKDKKPPYDILFCAFNDEERMYTKGGSSYFLEYIKEKYSSVFDINLDCLGNDNKSALYMTVNKTDESKGASEKMLGNLKAQNMDAQLCSEGFTSDHVTFKHAVCLTTAPDTNKTCAHSLEDTPDKINTAFLSEISEKLSNCIRDTINAIDIGKMKLAETSDSNEIVTGPPEDIMKPSDFEKKFNCKLDFLNPEQTGITIISRTGLSSTTGTPAEPKDISDIRHFSLIMMPCVMSITTYKTGSAQEMQLYKRELEANGFDDKSKAQKITIDKNDYYVFTQENDKTKFLNAEFNVKDMVIRVSIISSDFDKFSSPEQYQDFFEKNGLKKVIDGMTKLLKERD